MAYFRCGGTPSDVLALPTIGEASQANICQFNTDLTMNLLECICEIKATQSGSGTPSPANPRAINGHSELNLVRCGKNFYPTINSLPTLTINGVTFTRNNDGSISVEGTATETADFSLFGTMTSENNAFSVKAGTYTISATGFSADVGYVFGGGDGTSGLLYDDFRTSPKSKTVTLNAGTTGHNVIRVRAGATVNATVYIQWELGSTATAYAPYNGTPYLVSFGQTVYGGVYDANRGKVTLTWSTVNLGSYDWTYVTNEAHPYFYTNLIDKKLGVNIGMLCDSFVYVAGYRAAVIENNYQIGNFNNSDITIVVRDDDYTDVATFKTAMNGIILAYELATPIEIDVSELSVDTIVGVNNVFCDTGKTQAKFFETVGHHIA